MSIETRIKRQRKTIERRQDSLLRARQERNALIKAALDAGMTPKQIIALTGVSTATVSLIKNGRTP